MEKTLLLKMLLLLVELLATFKWMISLKCSDVHVIEIVECFLLFLAVIRTDR